MKGGNIVLLAGLVRAAGRARRRAALTALSELTHTGQYSYSTDGSRRFRLLPARAVAWTGHTAVSGCCRI